jgi:hypothetical protein
MKTYKDTTAEAAEKVKQEGFTVVEATPMELFVDLDSKDAMARFLSRINELIRLEVATKYRITKSKTPDHWHGYVTLRVSLTMPERIMYQCVLGSDLDHEFFSVIRYLEHGEEAKVVFFEPPKVSPYAVNCLYNVCGKVLLTKEQYKNQIANPHAKWRCPNCGDNASWDDKHYEDHLENEMAA